MLCGLYGHFFLRKVAQSLLLSQLNRTLFREIVKSFIVAVALPVAGGADVAPFRARGHVYHTIQENLSPSGSPAKPCQRGNKAMPGFLCVLFSPGIKTAL